MDHLEDALQHITSEIGIALIILLFLALLIAIVQLRTINKLKKKFSSQEEDEIIIPEKTIQKHPTFNEQKGLFEQLRTQLKSKTVELAKIAKENTERKQTLDEIKQKLLDLKENPQAINRISGEILYKIDSISSNNEDVFEIQIDELNQKFYKSLKNNFPDLTVNDLRLGAYIKMGMDSKEIANLLNIKPSSIYINRSRLRKKLNLEPEEDLYAFLNSDF